MKTINNSEGQGLQPFLKHLDRKLTNNEITTIKKKILNKEKQKDIAKEYNVGFYTISAIKNNKSYKDV